MEKSRATVGFSPRGVSFCVLLSVGTSKFKTGDVYSGDPQFGGMNIQGAGK